jgi:hypothetical protein
MTHEKIYALFKDDSSGPTYITTISARSLFEAKMKAKMQFKDEEMYIVDSNALKKVKGICKA